MVLARLMSPSTTDHSPKARLLSQKHDDDIIIVCALRTALTKAKKGAFKDTHPELLLAHVLRAVYTHVGLDPVLIDDIAVGTVLAPGGGATAARMAALHAGVPVSTPVSTVNRQCSSGLTAVTQIANAITAGQIDIGIGAGVESMTQSSAPASLPASFSPAVLSTPDAEDCLLPMGLTSENVARDFSVPRTAQDAFAAASFQKAAAASAAGKFKPEILPVRVRIVTPGKNNGVEEREIVVDADDGVRAGVTKEALGRLPPAFDEDGSTHAGNASQVSDGAAAVLLMKRQTALRLRLPVLGRFVAAAAVGVPPRIMGVGPAYAIPKVLEKTGLTKDDVDFFEINEAFASQALYCIDQLGIPIDRVNLHGGAIALGHPLGCSGARQIATGFNIAKQYGARVFVTSMCVGSGMGMAAVFVNEQE